MINAKMVNHFRKMLSDDEMHVHDIRIVSRNFSYVVWWSGIHIR